MTARRVLLSRRAEKAIAQLQPDERARVKQALLQLEQDAVRARPGADIKPLKGTTRLFRIRIGPWRALYGLHEGDVIVTDLFRKKRAYDL